MEFTKCSLCLIKCSPVKLSSEGKIKLEAEVLEHSLYGAKEDGAINNQLKIIFLLRKILEIPQEKCCNFLVEYGDPSSWMNCCSSCSDLIENCKIIFDKMTLLQNQFKKLQNEIKRTIILSICDKDEDYQYKWGVQEIVKSFISQVSSADLNIAVQNDVAAENNFYSDLNDTNSEEVNGLPEHSMLSSYFVETQWIETEDQQPSAHISYEANKDTFDSQDPLSPGENDGFKIENFVDLSKIKIDTGESCYLIENEEMISNDDVEKRATSAGCVNSIPDHVNSHTGGGDKPYECGFCEKRFTSSCNLKVHERTHTSEKPYKCTFCEKSFSQNIELKNHERIHTGEKPYGCGLCEKKFAQLNTLKLHEPTHIGEIHYQCSYCEKTFTQNSELKYHERSHIGEKAYECRFCEKRFTHGGAFKRHERTHTGEKPYQCTFCEKRFTTNGLLKNHERTHTGEKPYQCTFCEKRFTTNAQLKNHERIHTGEKPFGCRKCGKRFSLASNLRAHEKNVVCM